jgi:hypothetical protein
MRTIAVKKSKKAWQPYEGPKSKAFIKLCKKYGVDPDNVPEITSFEDACKALKYNPLKCLPKVSGVPAKHRQALIDHAKLIIIAEAFNNGWTPNWNDSSQYKYYPWFWVKADKKRPSGFGLSYHDYVFTRSFTNVGSRLCFKNSDMAIFAGKHFNELYKNYLLIL